MKDTAQSMTSSAGLINFFSSGAIALNEHIKGEKYSLTVKGRDAVTV